MHNIKRRIIGLTLAFLLVTIWCAPMNTFAASASLSISGGGSYNVGDTVRITYTYSGTTFGIADTYITYDPSVLQYTGCTATAPSSAAGAFSATVKSGTGSSTLSATVTFTALKAGNSNISFSTGSYGVYDYDGNPLNVASKSTTVSVSNPSPSVSGNANLGSLKVSAGSLSPSFSPSRTSYTVNVGEDVKVCTISATPQDSDATVSVGGSKNLSMGKNVRTVTVTAPSGATKTYTITINRGGASGETTEEPSDGSDPDEKPADIIVTVDEQEYVVEENYNESSIPDGFIMSVGQYGDNEIAVIKDENLKYTFVLLKNQATGDEEWFFYDEETDTFSKTAEISAEEAMEYGSLLSKLNGKDDSEPEGGNKTLFIVLGVTLAVLVIAVLILQVGVINKYKKTLKKNNDDKFEIKIEDEQTEDIGIEDEQSENKNESEE